MRFFTGDRLDSPPRTLPKKPENISKCKYYNIS